MSTILAFAINLTDTLQVQIEDLTRVLAGYYVPLLNPASSNAALVLAPSKLEAALAELRAAGLSK